MFNKVRGGSRSRRGAAVVEFAVIAPVFVVMIMGTIGTLKTIHAKTLMIQALREGGRLGAMDWTGVLPKGTTANDKVVADVKTFLTAAGMDAGQVEVTVTYADGPAAGSPFTLGAPGSYLQLFRLQAHLPHSSTNYFCSSLSEQSGLTSSVVFRAGRSTEVSP